MKKMIVAAMFALVIPSRLHAQPSTACDARAAFGVAGSLFTARTPVDPVRAGNGPHVLANTTRRGPEGSIHALVPIDGDRSLIAEFGVGTMHVAIERDAAGNGVDKIPAGSVSTQRFSAGFLNFAQGRRLCGYAGAKAGLYRFSYRGLSSAIGGVALDMGLETAMSASTTIFFELDLTIALNKAKPPLTDASIFFNLGPVVGIRHRF
ncbi:MAG TPA: hypothetical protein VH740_26730 [Vicinamibacterales bacterium]|jgi:hypothetical protein